MCNCGAKHTSFPDIHYDWCEDTIGNSGIRISIIPGDMYKVSNPYPASSCIVTVTDVTDTEVYFSEEITTNGSVNVTSSYWNIDTFESLIQSGELEKIS